MLKRKFFDTLVDWKKNKEKRRFARQERAPNR